MSKNPSIRLIQLAARSMGYDPGPIDGWWGKKTSAAVRALMTEGPVRSTDWAQSILRRGLRDLGYDLPLGIGLSHAVTLTLGRLLDNDGLPAASAVSDPAILEPTKPALRMPDHGNVLLQGSAGHVIDTVCLHCAAVPGDWWASRTNEQIAADIHRMHTDPVSRGGRGWSDTGYHAIRCPDGERINARPINRIGAGARGYNRGVFHLLMIEVQTINRTKRPEDYFTPETLAGAKQDIADIAAQTPIRRLMGHREVAAKLCPGFEVVDRDFTDLAVA